MYNARINIEKNVKTVGRTVSVWQYDDLTERRAETLRSSSPMSLEYGL